MKITLYQDDIPPKLTFGNSIAIDTEAMGLNHQRDRLCLIQLSSGNGICYLIQINNILKKPKNLLKILKDNKVQKIFHFARFDVGILKHTYQINIKNIYCTKIASKLARTFTDKHGYKDLCLELLKKTILKEQQTSDWGSKKLSIKQQQYAATDVLHLHKIRDKLNEMLLREDRNLIAKECFDFLEHRISLDLMGWSDIDIFKH